MSVYSYISIIITLAAFISYVNYRFVRIQPTIAIMGTALLISLFFILVGHFGFPVSRQKIEIFITGLHFHDLVMNFMLGLLLFAGSLTVNLSYLKKQQIEVAILSIVGTVLSAFIIAILAYTIMRLIDFPAKFVYCFLFGSLISPTDPIAVIAIFKKLGAPKQLETIVSAESLFNDGVGVVLFLTAYSVAFSGTPATFLAVSELFLRETLGGLAYGLILGWLAFRFLRPVRDSKVQILVTIAVVLGGYTLAQAIGISGPLAMVAAGIFLGNCWNKQKKSQKSSEELKHFWELVDELLNTVLFLLLGFELLSVHFHVMTLFVGILMIPVCLIARYLVVALPIALIWPWRKPMPYTVTILTWGGLRGGLAVALALSLPPGDVRDVILMFTYIVVLFAILVQGSTIKRFVALLNRQLNLK